MEVTASYCCTCWQEIPSYALFSHSTHLVYSTSKAIPIINNRLIQHLQRGIAIERHCSDLLNQLDPKHLQIQTERRIEQIHQYFSSQNLLLQQRMNFLLSELQYHRNECHKAIVSKAQQVSSLKESISQINQNVARLLRKESTLQELSQSVDLRTSFPMDISVLKDLQMTKQELPTFHSNSLKQSIQMSSTFGAFRARKKVNLVDKMMNKWGNVV